MWPLEPCFASLTPALAFLNLGPGELMVIGLIALLVFGSRLPEVGRSLGRGMMEFKKGLSGIKDEVDDIQTQADQQIDEELERRRTQELIEHAGREADLHEGEEPEPVTDPDAGAEEEPPTDPEEPRT